MRYTRIWPSILIKVNCVGIIYVGMVLHAQCVCSYVKCKCVCSKPFWAPIATLLFQLFSTQPYKPKSNEAALLDLATEIGYASPNFYDTFPPCPPLLSSVFLLLLLSSSFSSTFLGGIFRTVLSALIEEIIVVFIQIQSSVYHVVKKMNRLKVQQFF